LNLGKNTDLLQDGAIITDFFDSKNLGDSKPGDYFEINGKKVFIAGQTRGVRSFGGIYAFTTIERARALGKVNMNRASAFLITWRGDATQDQVIATINGTIKGVRAWRSDEFAKETIFTVLKSGGIALSFGTLIFFALVVGFVIIGLTLYSAAIDRIRDYGTLKAIGATNGYIRRLILTQALLISFIGFLVAMALVEGFRRGIANAGTFFAFPNWLYFAFFGVTVLIAVTGSLFAIRRMVNLEPAAVFRG
jgi:putative ABC transport system permease protein